MAAVDPFPNSVPSLDSPETDAAAVTPSDTVDLGFVSTRLYVGGAGAVTVIMLGGETVTFGAVPAGTTLPIRVSRVKATGTTATSIVALW